MFNPINIAFKKAKQENRPALLTYTVAGDSSKKQSLEILKSISKEVDILETLGEHIDEDAITVLFLEVSGHNVNGNVVS